MTAAAAIAVSRAGGAAAETEADASPPSAAQVRRILRAALPAGAKVAVRFVTAAASRELNQRYLAKDRPANVLAFPAEDGGPGGDIAICPAVVAAEAKQCNVPAFERYAHLLVHAALHLQGFEHETAAAARRMEAREAEVMASLGLPDPWAADKA
ncbi:MAG: rRNA maturation RNase YbeY [Betaproteobacteria bacterium AqS2]|uniref:Endoribonuclease YbeY n=1 Tax=Candidatus Amphirhobacter heronislandensis TaxID=1732024 RepID=A0A930Y3H4_9GAMM|nr:rRNA maturation RNase YbeY [Betaproteobacteria bacterium AqS2]